MANIQINNLQLDEFEFAELSDLELESVVGGKERKPQPKTPPDANDPFAPVDPWTGRPRFHRT